MVKISADSTCDLSPELLKRYDVAIQPLYIVRDDASLRDGVDIRPTDIFAYVEQAGKLLKTAAVSVEDYIELFRRRTADGSEVVHITISAEMSACYQNACLAAREVPGVYPCLLYTSRRTKCAAKRAASRAWSHSGRRRSGRARP